MTRSNETFDRRTAMKTIGGVTLSGWALTGTVVADHADPGTRIVDGDGSGDFHYATIQAAVNDAAPGDRIEVQPGVYHEAVNVTTDDLTIVGDPGDPTEIGPGNDAPIVDGSTLSTTRAAGFDLRRSSGITVAGFEVRNFPQTEWGTGIKDGQSAITIRDNYVHDVSANGISRPGWGNVDPDNFTIKRNRVEAAGAVGIRLDNASSSVITENEVHGSDGTENAIFIHNNVGKTDWGGQPNDTSVDNTDVGVTANTVTGTFGGPAVWVLNINRNDPAELAGTHARLSDVRFQDNAITVDDAPVGLGVATNAVHGSETRLEAVVIEDNRVVAPHNGVRIGGDPNVAATLTGIQVGTNTITALAGIEAVNADELDIEGNDVEGTGDGVGIEIHGVEQPAVASAAVADNDVSGVFDRGVHVGTRESQLSTVNIVGNTVAGDIQNQGVSVAANGRNDATSGVNDITIRDNSIDAEVGWAGILLEAAKYDATVADVTVENNVVSSGGAAGGVTIWGNGVVGNENESGSADGTISAVDVRDNRLANGFHGVEIRARGTASRIETVVVEGNALEANNNGCTVAAIDEGAVTGVDVTENALVANEFGCSIPARDDAEVGTIDVNANEVRDNRIGLGVATFDQAGLGSVALEENEIEDNIDRGISIAADNGTVPVSVELNNVSGNGVGLANDTDGEVVAECNYWGHATGPQHDDNPRNQPMGDPIEGDVAFVPWSVRPIRDGEGTCVGGRGGGSG